MPPRVDDQKTDDADAAAAVTYLNATYPITLYRLNNAGILDSKVVKTAEDWKLLGSEWVTTEKAARTRTLGTSLGPYPKLLYRFEEGKEVRREVASEDDERASIEDAWFTSVDAASNAALAQAQQAAAEDAEKHPRSEEDEARTRDGRDARGTTDGDRRPRGNVAPGVVAPGETLPYGATVAEGGSGIPAAYATPRQTVRPGEGQGAAAPSTRHREAPAQQGQQGEGAHNTLLPASGTPVDERPSGKGGSKK